MSLTLKPLPLPALRLIDLPQKQKSLLTIPEPQARSACVQKGRTPQSRSFQAIRSDLAKVAAVWEKVQQTRERDAVYDYLKGVRDLVSDWERRGRADRKARRALRSRGLKVPKHLEPYAAVIACTSTADIKARSKWARALRYFASRPPKGESLKSFMKANGGINGCASLFARRFGRKKKA